MNILVLAMKKEIEIPEYKEKGKSKMVWQKNDLLVRAWHIHTCSLHTLCSLSHTNTHKKERLEKQWECMLMNQPNPTRAFIFKHARRVSMCVNGSLYFSTKYSYNISQIQSNIYIYIISLCIAIRQRFIEILCTSFSNTSHSQRYHDYRHDYFFFIFYMY